MIGRPLPLRFILVLVAPACAVIFFFCIWPLLAAGWISFHLFRPLLGIDYTHVTIGNYLRLLREDFYLSVFLRTFRISLVVTGVCLLLGYPTAYYISQRRKKVQGILLLIYMSPWLVSVVVKAYAWMLLLSPRGIIPEFLVVTGITASPPAILWTESAVVIGLVHVYLLFMIFPIFTNLTMIDGRVIAAAKNLGARWHQQFLRVLFPLSMPGVMAGSLLVFSLSMSAFATPALLGGERVQVVSFVAYRQSLALFNWPFGAAIAFGLLGISGLVVFLYQRWYRSSRLGWRI